MKELYDWLTDWNVFINQYGSEGSRIQYMFKADIYPAAGKMMLSITGIVCALYYFYFNKRFGVYYTRRWYGWFFIIALALVFGFTLGLGLISLSAFSIPTWLMVLNLSFVNVLYSAIMFFICSLIFQIVAIISRRYLRYDLSPMGSRTLF